MNNYLPTTKLRLGKSQQNDFLHRVNLYSEVFNNSKQKVMTSHLSKLFHLLAKIACFGEKIMDLDAN